MSDMQDQPVREPGSGGTAAGWLKSSAFSAVRLSDWLVAHLSWAYFNNFDNFDNFSEPLGFTRPRQAFEVGQAAGEFFACPA